MNVLHFTNKPIFPLLDGGRLATHNLLLNLLDLGFNVKNLTVETFKHPFLPETFDQEILKTIDTESVFIKTKINFWKAFVSMLKKQSYNVIRFQNLELENKIITLLKDNTYDYVIIESSFLLLYLKTIRDHSDAKIILRSHNVEYRIWRQAAKKEKSFFKKKYYNLLANQLKKFELEKLNLVDGIFCISEKDKEFFRRRGIKTKMEVIPVFMEVKDNYIVDYECNDFFFIGSMNWKPNEDAVKWILTQIIPRFKKIYPDFKFHIAGSNMSKQMKTTKNNNVIFHGRVDDIYEFMSKHGTLIVPLKTGSGVRIKILEALSVGVPIISNDKGKEGIDIIPKKEFLSANMTEEFILQMKYIYNNYDLKTHIGSNGKIFIEQNYTKEIVSNKISEFIKKI
jgi:glycosyltransferase involved in cell wall biosynthesis